MSLNYIGYIILKKSNTTNICRATWSVVFEFLIYSKLFKDTMMISCIEIGFKSFCSHLDLLRFQIAGEKYSHRYNMRNPSQNQFLDTSMDA
jgi:hypothetical protein